MHSYLHSVLISSLCIQISIHIRLHQSQYSRLESNNAFTDLPPASHPLLQHHTEGVLKEGEVKLAVSGIRKMQICIDNLLTFMTHGNVIFDIYGSLDILFVIILKLNTSSLLLFAAARLSAA